MGIILYNMSSFYAIFHYFIEQQQICTFKKLGVVFWRKKSPCGNTAASTQLLKITKYCYFIQYFIMLCNIPSFYIIFHYFIQYFIILYNISLFYRKTANMHFQKN